MDEFLDSIWKKCRSLPFALRWFTDEFSKTQLEEMSAKLKRMRLIRSYPELVESNRQPVAQAEHTVGITESGPLVLTQPNRLTNQSVKNTACIMNAQERHSLNYEFLSQESDFRLRESETQQNFSGMFPKERRPPANSHHLLIKAAQFDRGGNAPDVTGLWMTKPENQLPMRGVP